MQVNIHQIFRTIEPYRIIRDLGLPIKEEKLGFTIAGSHIPKHRLWFNQAGFVSLDPACEFVAGSIFDFLAFHIGSYRLALNHVLRHHRNFAAAFHEASLDVNFETHIQQLETDRLYFQNIYKLRWNLEERPQDYREITAWVRRQKWDLRNLTAMFYAAKGDELLRLFPSDSDSSWLQPCDTYLVLPFLNNHHTYVRLLIRSVNKAEDDVVIQTHNRAANAFFGLHTVNPLQSDIRVTRTVEQALNVLHLGQTSGNRTFGAVHMWSNSRSKDPYTQLPHGTFILNSDLDVDVAAKSRSGFEKYRVANFSNSILSSTDIISEPWSDFALNHFRTVFNEEKGITPRVSCLIEDLKLDPGVCSNLLQYLNEAKEFKLAAAVQRRIQTANQFSIGDALVLETPSGYVAQKFQSGQTTVLTNFTMKLDYSVYFDDTQDLFHYGIVFVGDNQYPVCIPDDAITRRIELESSIMSSILRSSGGNITFKPIFHNSAAFKYVSGVLSNHISGKSALPGIKSLGWTDNRSQFVTPVWSLSISGLSSKPHIGHPTCKLLRDHYTFRQFTFSESTEQVTPQIRAFIALFASMLTHLFLKRDFPVIPILNNAPGMKLLYALFQPFGQKSAIMLNVNKRAKMSLVPEEVLNYPVFGTTNDSELLANKSGYVFALSRAGLVFHEDFDQVTYYQTCTLVYQVTTQLLMSFMRSTLQAENLLNGSASNTVEHMVLGRRLIERLTSFKNFTIFDDDMPNFRGVLSTIAFEDLQKYFYYDLGSSCIVMKFLTIQDYRRKDVYDELVKKHESATMYQNTKIMIQAEPMTELLTKFYDRPVTIFAKPEDKAEDAVPTETLDGLAQSET